MGEKKMSKSKDIKLVVRQSLGFRLKERMPVTIDCGGESRTKQAFKDEVDINNIVRKFQDGVVPVMNNLEPQYGDSPTMDLKEALDSVFAVKGEFANLSNDQQSLFDYSEANYFDFLANPDEFLHQIRDKFGSQSEANLGSDSPSAEPSETNG